MPDNEGLQLLPLVKVCDGGMWCGMGYVVGFVLHGDWFASP